MTIGLRGQRGRPTLRRHRTLKLAAVLGTGALVATLLGAPTSTAATNPVLTLERGSSSVTGYVFDEGSALDLGVHVVAGSKAVEVQAHRHSYREPLEGEWVLKGNDKEFPTGSVREDFSGLADFFHLTITDSQGKVVSSGYQDFCPNTYQPTRRRPDAPNTSPYPQSCSDANPYSLGAVFGIQAGYAVPAFGYFGEDTPVTLAVGEYTARIEIAPRWQKRFGLKGGRNSATVQVTMVELPEEEDPGLRPAARRQLRAARQLTKAQEAPERQARAAVQKAPTRLLGTAQSKPSGPLPDLRSLPAWGIYVEGGRYLSFNATVWNAGRIRLMIDGFRRQDQKVMDAYQYFFSSSGKAKGYRSVGTMEWDAKPEHNHWHFTDFATYRLLDSNKQLVTTSGKEAFCLANTDMVDYTIKGANWRPFGTDLSTACGDESAVGVREVLDSGSGDTYNQVQNDSFDLLNLPNGTYYIEVLANPEKKLYESSTKNNTSYRKIVIGGPAGARTVTVPQVGIIDEPPIDVDDEEDEDEE